MSLSARSKDFLLQGVCLSLMLVFGSVSPANGQDKGTPLALEEAVQIGLKKNPRVAGVQSQVDASLSRIGQARSGFYPQVDISESFQRTTNPMWAFGTRLNQESITQMDFDPSRLNDPKAINNLATTLSVKVPVYDRGQTRGAIKQAELDHQAFSQLGDRIRQQVIVDVVVSYLGVLLAMENLSVVDQTLETAKAHHKMVRSRYESGLVVKSDLLRAEVRIAELEQMRVHSKGQEDIARVALNAAMGVEMDQAYQLLTPLEGRIKEAGLMETWIRKALQTRPDLRQMRLREMIAEEEVEKAKSAHMPGLYLSGNYEMDSEDFGETANNYTFGAVMQFNLFSGFALQSKVNEAQADLRRAKAMVRHMEVGIEAETRQAYLGARSAYQRIGVAGAAIQQAEEGLRIVRNRYESGLFTIVNLLDAEVALYQTRTNYLRAIHDYRVAIAQLQLAAGTVDEGL